MGKDFTPLVLNDLKADYVRLINLLYWRQNVVEASKESYFFVLPEPREIKEIELGFSGTEETIIRFHSGEWLVLNKTLELLKEGEAKIL